jgi:hypothetical protein
MSQEESLARISEALKNIKQSDAIESAEIIRRIEAQYALVEELQQWLDTYLKN